VHCRPWRILVVLGLDFDRRPCQTPRLFRRGTHAFDTFIYRTDSSRPAEQSTELSAVFVRVRFHATDEKARARADLKTRITRGDHWPPQKAEGQMVRKIANKPTNRSVAAGSSCLSRPPGQRRAMRCRFGPPHPIRAGWALVSPTLCKSAVHSEVVRIHPCPPNSRPATNSANLAQWESTAFRRCQIPGRHIRFSYACLLPWP
jgi:hypothetical protein